MMGTLRLLDPQPKRSGRPGSPHMLLVVGCWLSGCLVATAQVDRAPAPSAQQAADAVVIKGVFDLFTTDELGSVYALQGDEIQLYDAKGKRLIRNSLKTFGSISSIDVFSSLKPMIFSRTQGMLAALDNTLAIQGDPIDLNRSGFPQVTLACMSVQNCYWFFDERLLQLTRVDHQLRSLSATGRLDQLLGFSPRPVSMQEFESWLYVCDPEQGVLVFDIFGGYAKTIPIVGAAGLEVRDGHILYLKDGVLHSYDLKSFDIDLPVTWLATSKEKGLRDARIERGLLYALYPDRIVIAPAVE